MEKDSSPTWAVVATVSEPRELLLPFVAHHIACGAAAVYIYLDNPDGELTDELETNPACQVTQCSDVYWSSKSNGGRPTDHRLRQTTNANDAFQKSLESWLIHLDADELLLCDDDIRKKLAGLAPGIERAKVVNDERVFLSGKRAATVFEGLARKEARNSPWLVRLLYGNNSQYLHKGMVGHSAGKSFLKVGADASMKIHGADRQVRTETLAGTRLLHFDGLTRLHWIDKLYSKSVTSQETPGHSRSGARQSQIDFASGPGLVRERMDQLFSEIMEFSPIKAFLFKLTGLAAPIDMSIETEIEEAYPKAIVDLSPENLDRSLAQNTRRVLYRDCVFNVNLLNNFTGRLIGVTGETREERELDWLTEKLQGQKINLFDVGANIGLYSVSLGRQMDSRSKIVAIECNPTLVRRLKMNIDDNRLTNISICESALSNTSGFAELNIISAGNMGESTLNSSSMPANTEAFRVPCMTLLESMDKYEVSKIDFMKVDIEGHELTLMSHFFDHAPKERFPSLILLEMKHDDGQVDELHRRMLAEDYEVVFQTENNRIYAPAE